MFKDNSNNCESKIENTIGQNIQTKPETVHQIFFDEVYCFRDLQHSLKGEAKAAVEAGQEVVSKNSECHESLFGPKFDPHRLELINREEKLPLTLNLDCTPDISPPESKLQKNWFRVPDSDCQPEFQPIPFTPDFWKNYEEKLFKRMLLPKEQSQR